MQFSSKQIKIQRKQIHHRIRHEEYILNLSYVYLRSEGTVFMRKRKKSLASKFPSPVYRKKNMRLRAAMKYLRPAFSGPQ